MYFLSNSRQIQTNAHLQWGEKKPEKIHTRKKQGHRLIPLHPLPYGYVLGNNQNSSHFTNGLPINKNILPRVKDHLQWH